MFSGVSLDVVGNTLTTLVPLLLGVIGGSIIFQFLLFQFLAKVIKTNHALPYTLLAPAAIAILVFLIYPLVYNVALAFSDLKRDTFACYSPVSIGQCELDHLYGFDYAWENFKDVFVRERDGEILGWGRLLRTADSTFPILLTRTFLWTSINVVFHFGLGMALALAMNQKIRFKSIYRALIVVPWAIPGVIVSLTWRQEFHSQYGFVNILIEALGGQGISWLDDPFWAFVAVLFVNIWLGVPFYMVMLLGGLQSISPDYYEAAQMDGASPIQQFFNITLPLLQPIIIPAITLDVIWTFNKLDVIFLVTGGGPQESTNILVSALYNAAFGPSATTQLGFSAAFSIIIFAILFIFAIIWIVTSGGLKEIYER